ncbi:MAG: histidine kinase [Muribaculaceae bacterium]|nr:histidine kinase [Muribaculaceae bacterium]
MSKRKFCFLYLLGVLIFYLWYQAVVNVLYSGKLLAYENFTDFIIGFAINGLMIFMLFILNTTIVYGIKWRRNKIYRVLLDLTLSFLAPLITNSIFLLICQIFGKDGEVLWLQAYVINVMIFLINESSFFLVNYKRQERMYQMVQRVAAQLEYDVLRAQLNPHFLFNSLNILYSLIHLDVEKSRDFLLSLSRMYRYIMSRRANTIVSVKDELDFLDSYVEVLKMLYLDCFKIEINNPDKYLSRDMIPYSLQLLIENVTKHNVISKNSPMTVSIDMGEDGLTVSNPLHPKNIKPDRETGSGVGLTYLTKLYNLHGKTISKQKTDTAYIVHLPYL